MLWLWRRLAAAAPIQPLGWELPKAAGEAQKKKKKRKKQKKKKENIKKKKKKKNKKKIKRKKKTKTCTFIEKIYLCIICMFVVHVIYYSMFYIKTYFSIKTPCCILHIYIYI